MIVKLTDGDDWWYGNAYDELIYGYGGNDYIRGSNGMDTINGGTGNDKIFGDRGNDRLEGGDGNDIIRGGKGDDYLYGDKGNDILRGDRGDDLVHGREGDDMLYGGRGIDTMEGGEGSDTFIIDFKEKPDIISTARNKIIILDFEIGIDKLKHEGAGLAKIHWIKKDHLTPTGDLTIFIEPISLENSGDRRTVFNLLDVRYADFEEFFSKEGWVVSEGDYILG